jgi:hypothetical protein
MHDMRSNRFKSSAQGLVGRHGMIRVYDSQTGQSEYDMETQTTTFVTQLFTIKMFKTKPTYKEAKSPNLVERNLSAFLISPQDLTVKPQVGDKIRDIYSGVEDVLEVLSWTEYEGLGSICMYRVLCAST